MLLMPAALRPGLLLLPRLLPVLTLFTSVVSWFSACLILLLSRLCALTLPGLGRTAWSAI